MLIKAKRKAPKFCSKTFPRINQYNSALVNEMVTAAKWNLGSTLTSKVKQQKNL